MAGKGKSTGHTSPPGLGGWEGTSVQSARLREALVITAPRIFLHLTMSIQCGPLTESWDLRPGKKPRRPSAHATPRISDTALPSEPRAARKKHSEAASMLIKREDASHEYQIDTRSSTKPRPKTTMAATTPSPPPPPETTRAATTPSPPPPRSRRTSRRTCHYLAVVQTLITYVVGVMTFCALVMMWQRLGWGLSRPTHLLWNVLSSHNPAFPRFELDSIAASCRPSRYPDCEGIPAMLYQLNGDLTRTNWAIETLGYRLGDALSRMTDPSSKSGCAYLRRLQSDLGTVQKYGDGVRAAVATAALEEEAILSLVTLVGLDVSHDLKVLFKEVNTGGRWIDILVDSDGPHRRDRQWRECTKCKHAMELCVGDLRRGMDILDQEAKRYALLKATLDEIGKQIEATLVAAAEEGEDGNAQCTRDMLQRIKQSFTQAIARAVNGDLLSLKPPQ